MSRMLRAAALTVVSAVLAGCEEPVIVLPAPTPVFAVVHGTVLETEGKGVQGAAVSFAIHSGLDCGSEIVVGGGTQPTSTDEFGAYSELISTDDPEEVGSKGV